MIVGSILVVLAFCALVGFVGNLNMSSDDHRRAAQKEALMSTRVRNTKQATAHAQRAQSHSFLADEKENGHL